MANTVTDIQRRDYREEPQQFTQVMQFTPEELKVWQECMKNSSVFRPTLLSMVVGYGICKVTPFRAKANYVAVISGIVGMVSSRISITNKCLTKVTSMPDSNLKERLREMQLYRNNKFQSLHYKGFQPTDVQSEMQTSDERSNQEPIVFDDYPTMHSYDTYSSLNDSSDFHSSSEETDLTEPINPQKSVSYDELRHKNREEFYNKNRQWSAPKREQSTRENEATQQQASRSEEPHSNVPSVQQKNKYGDVWG